MKQRYTVRREDCLTGVYFAIDDNASEPFSTTFCSFHSRDRGEEQTQKDAERVCDLLNGDLRNPAEELLERLKPHLLRAAFAGR